MMERKEIASTLLVFLLLRTWEIHTDEINAAMKKCLFDPNAYFNFEGCDGPWVLIKR